MSLFLSIFIVLGLGFSSLGLSVSNGLEISHRKLNDAPCPLDFDDLRKMVIKSFTRLDFLDVQTECRYILNGIRMVRSQYLQASGFFSFPSNASEACWDSYQILVNEFILNFDIRSTCGVQSGWISESCMNITTPSQFETLIPESKMQEIRGSCNQSLRHNYPCSSCINSLSSLQSSYLRGPEVGNVSDCTGYPLMYAAALVNRFGPTDLWTAMCLFSLDFTVVTTSSTKRHKIVIFGVVVGCAVGLLGTIFVVWFLWRWHKKRRNGEKNFVKTVKTAISGLESISGSTTLVKFTFEEVKEATRNFSWENIIGKGGYGNVFKGILPDGSEVALKRLKNCSGSGDESFTHEVEVIASVRHVNLVALRGYCTTTVPLEGHQRIIVCDLMHNGSLYDHLFGSGEKKLSWSIRQKIALGMARGLAYLHYGAQPTIIHRDIKASNILLDEAFEPKLADFGLAKFTPEGLSHLSTRVAGTLGYVAPEYALYGQLTERSDVYSFGVVLLELLSGKKAVISVDDGQALLLTDWAWSLVRNGRALDVIEEGMPELGLPEVMERYVFVAVLSSHPLLYARPKMDQIVTILETNLPVVPLIPYHPLRILGEIVDIERLVTRTGLSSMSSLVDPQLLTIGSDHPSLDSRKNEEISQ